MPFATSAVRDRARRRIAQLVKAGEPCALCHQPIDLDLKYPHPMSFTVDHHHASSLGGSDHIANLRPAHNECNRLRSALPDGSIGRNSGVLG